MRDPRESGREVVMRDPRESGREVVMRDPRESGREAMRDPRESRDPREMQDQRINRIDPRNLKRSSEGMLIFYIYYLFR